MSERAVQWHAEARRLRAEGLTVREIAEALGKGHSTVGDVLAPCRCACGQVRTRKAEKCADCRNADKRWLAERVEELVAGMYDDGWPLKDIAAVLGRSVPSPRAAGRATGPEMDRARKRGLIRTTRVRTGYGTWGQVAA